MIQLIYNSETDLYEGISNGTDGFNGLELHHLENVSPDFEWMKIEDAQTGELIEQINFLEKNKIKNQVFFREDDSSYKRFNIGNHSRFLKFIAKREKKDTLNDVRLSCEFINFPTPIAKFSIKRKVLRFGRVELTAVGAVDNDYIVYKIVTSSYYYLKDLKKNEYYEIESIGSLKEGDTNFFNVMAKEFEVYKNL